MLDAPHASGRGRAVERAGSVTPSQRLVTFSVNGLRSSDARLAGLRAGKQASGWGSVEARCGEGTRRGEEGGRKGDSRSEVVAIQGAMPKPHERLRCRSRTHGAFVDGHMSSAMAVAGGQPTNQVPPPTFLNQGLDIPPLCYLAHLGTWASASALETDMHHGQKSFESPVACI